MATDFKGTFVISALATSQSGIPNWSKPSLIPFYEVGQHTSLHIGSLSVITMKTVTIEPFLAINQGSIAHRPLIFFWFLIGHAAGNHAREMAQRFKPEVDIRIKSHIARGTHSSALPYCSAMTSSYNHHVEVRAA